MTLSRTARPLLVAVVLLAGGAGLVALPRADAAPAARCRGYRATIVGAPGRDVEGTEGDDVIVASGDVRGGAGDDLICTTGHLTYAGPGDDTIVARTGTSGYHAGFLGPGDDTYLGGRGQDTVNYRDVDLGVERRADPGNDTVSTGAGADSVILGFHRGGPDRMHLDLGPGSDVLAIASAGAAASSRVTGGPGGDVLQVERYLLHRRSVHLDLGRRTLSAGSEPRLSRWSGIELYRVDGFPGTTTIRGSGGSDHLHVTAAHRLDVRLGRGDDGLSFGEPEHATGSVDLGRGTDDWLLLDIADHPWRVDLPRHLFGIPGEGPAQIGVTGVEDVTTAEGTVVGDAADNTVSIGCGSASGGGGDDHLFYNVYSGCTSGVAYDGGPGDDVLGGSPGDDTLVGGADTDVADGGDGTDTCEAETVRACESVTP